MTDRPRSALRLHDLLDEVIAGIVQRPARAALTSVGTALGLAAFVAVLGITVTASSQVSSRFTALSATEVSLERSALTDHDSPAFPEAAQQRVRALAGVRQVGISWPARITPETTVSAQPVSLRGRQADILPVRAATPGYLRAIHANVSHGTLFDEFHTTRAERVAILGSVAAHQLGVSRIDAQPAVFIGDLPFTVIGIVGAVDRNPDALLSVIIPDQTVAAIWGPAPASGNSTQMLIETDLGAAQQVGRQAKIAVRPDTPDETKAIVPPDPRTLRDQITTDLDTLFLLLAAISLFIGAVGIANTSLVAVLERIPEIGLRRALGASRRHIAAQFLLESATLGVLGGIAGTVIGILTVLIVSLTQTWTPSLNPGPSTPPQWSGAPSAYSPASTQLWRASRTEPATALRR